MILSAVASSMPWTSSKSSFSAEFTSTLTTFFIAFSAFTTVLDFWPASSFFSVVVVVDVESGALWACAIGTIRQPMNASAIRPETRGFISNPPERGNERTRRRALRAVDARHRMSRRTWDARGAGATRDVFARGPPPGERAARERLMAFDPNEWAPALIDLSPVTSAFVALGRPVLGPIPARLGARRPLRGSHPHRTKT